MSFIFKRSANRIVLRSNVPAGVKRIAKVFAGDVDAVLGFVPEILENADGVAGCDGDVIIETREIPGRWQSYDLKIKDGKLFITGTDVLGTIYGIFHVSKLIGVSPLVYFGDAAPLKKDVLEIKDLDISSKNPSVRYRGFFINDEWPCFGTWVNTRFSGFNAKSYEVIFEFLLRMNGNFLWPAMWTASFPIDGPGQLNEELATELGITVSYSHHEPCLRASEEWKKVNGPDTPYGTAWDFRTNEQGLTNYWRDSLVRSGKQNHLVTIGMRGEYDSILMGDASLAENINTLKRIILAQQKLIKETGVTLPQTLAVYKEVEQYFYGDKDTPGLMGWEALDDVILMLCEDNQGHMRGLPTKRMRSHKGGYGMYYHLDYHGGPVSFEWVNSTTLNEVWEEMTEAYESGIDQIWIVNVGDIKFNEIPLYYFLQLAYDFEKWGSGKLDSPTEFTEMFMREAFPAENDENIKRLCALLTDAYRLNARIRPERVHAGVFDPLKDFELDRMINTAEELETRGKALNDLLSPESRTAFYSMILYPLLASTNLYLMWLYSDKGTFLAKQGKSEACEFAVFAENRIKRDGELADEFDRFLSGKWHGMQLEEHVGFTTWNDDDHRYPIVSHFTPVKKPSLKVSKADEARVYVKCYGRPMRLTVNRSQTYIEISNSGTGEIEYEIEGELKAKTRFTDIYRIDEKARDGEDHIYRVKGKDGTTVEIETKGFEAKFMLSSRREFGDIRGYKEPGCITLTPSEAAEILPGKQGSFMLLNGYGKYDEGLKVLGMPDDYGSFEEASKAVWEFESDTEGELKAVLVTAPTNPLKFGGALNVFVSSNDDIPEILNLVPSDFKAGENSDPRWCRDVIANERRTEFSINAVKGVNRLCIAALEAGVIIERIMVYGTKDAD